MELMQPYIRSTPSGLFFTITTLFALPLISTHLEILTNLTVFRPLLINIITPNLTVVLQLSVLLLLYRCHPHGVRWLVAWHALLALFHQHGGELETQPAVKRLPKLWHVAPLCLAHVLFSADIATLTFQPQTISHALMQQ
jgi:hypothetical protein